MKDSISYEKILNITDAFQIASGQTFAIDSTKGILDYITNFGNICITGIPNNVDKYIETSYDLSTLYKSIDKSIDISLDTNFSKYFNH